MKKSPKEYHYNFHIQIMADYPDMENKIKEQLLEIFTDDYVIFFVDFRHYLYRKMIILKLFTYLIFFNLYFPLSLDTGHLRLKYINKLY